MKSGEFFTAVDIKTSQEKPTVIVHCSDIHFGHGFLPDKAEKFAAEINTLQPDAVVVSGDLTMRARESQFLAAREFVKSFNAKTLVIPGNHDVPLYDVIRRTINPFKLYKRHIEDLNEGPFTFPNVSLYGLNTVNPFRHQQGKFRMLEVLAMKNWFAQQPEDNWRVTIVHQHFANIPGHERPGVYPKAEKWLAKLVENGTQAVLHGHVHYNHIASATEFFPQFEGKVALITAGTPTSHRIRGVTQCNNYNVLKFYKDKYEIHQCQWQTDSGKFAACHTVTFDRNFYK